MRIEEETRPTKEELGLPEGIVFADDLQSKLTDHYRENPGKAGTKDIGRYAAIVIGKLMQLVKDNLDPKHCRFADDKKTSRRYWYFSPEVVNLLLTMQSRQDLVGSCPASLTEKLTDIQLTAIKSAIDSITSEK